MTAGSGGGTTEAAPDHRHLEQMRRASAALFVVGGLVCLSGVWMTQETPESRFGQGVVAGTFLVVGCLVSVVRPPRRWLIETAVVGSVVLLGVLVAVSDPLGMAPFFYLWPVVFAAYFCSTKLLVVAYGTTAVTLAAALVVNDGIDLKLDTFTGTVATVGAMGALIHTMTRQERQLRDELALAADTDPLTGLLNRRSFDPRLRVLVDRAAERQLPLSLVIVDIDHFKVLNDTYGHLVGDDALRALARVLVASSRDGDLVARIGGEEFVVALPGASSTAARRYAERVAGELEALSAGGAYVLAVSAGVCGLSDDAADATTLLARADEALYAAKAGGRCRVAWWDGVIEVGDRFGEATSAH